MRDHIPAPEEPNASSPPFRVAIIGSGLVGLTLAIGLTHRNIPVTIYEKAQAPREIGVGIAFSSATLDMLAHLSPAARDAVVPLAVPSRINGFIDLATEDDVAARAEDGLLDIDISEHNTDAVAFPRAALAAALAGMLPAGVVVLGKKATGVSELGDGMSEVAFEDGTTARAHAVIGCDGVRSFVRRVVAPASHPSSTSHYAHECVYRCLADFSAVSPILGPVAERLVIWVGQGIYLIGYPIANKKFLNVVCGVDDRGEWPNPDNHASRCDKAELMSFFKDAGPSAKKLLEALPQEQSKWALFDTLDHPLESYARGCVAVAGDAAHAATPHRGAGTAMGVEDALVLVTVLEDLHKGLKEERVGRLSTSEAVKEAFRIYDTLRRPRSQWLVANSRRQGERYKEGMPGLGEQREEFVRETLDGFFKSVRYDWKGIIAQAREMFQEALNGKKGQD